MIYKFILILLFSAICSCTQKSSDKYLVCWIQKSEEGGLGRCRHNGVLTDSGYVFSDTIWSHKLEKKIVLTTRVIIRKVNE